MTQPTPARVDGEIPRDYPLRLKRLRGRLGLTQVRLADLLGVSFASINRWENGQAKPSTMAWRLIVRAEEGGVDALATPAPAAPAPEPAVSAEVSLDFSADPEVVRTVAEAERLTYVHLFNPSFATETSLIDPLPHQRMAVYNRMLLQPRLRFLLADDAGAGKTIMAGLYIREMLIRRLIRRVLIVPPAGLLGNWERELRTLFSLSFRIVRGPDARSANPFVGPESDLVIVSMDTLAGDRMFARLQEPSVQPYDLVIFDEAHKLSAHRDPDGTFRPTDRYRLAEALAGVPAHEPRWALPWHSNHLLLLTATPHMGKEFPYFCLWRLLEPDVLTTLDAFNAYPRDARDRHFIRRTKEEMVSYDGKRIYPTRVSDTLSYDLTQGEIGEQTLYDQTTDYLRFYYNQARILNRSAARLALSIFQRRLASSTWALLCSFERRIRKLDALIEDIRSGRITEEELRSRQMKLDKVVHDVQAEVTGDEEEAEGGREENEVAEEHAMTGTVAVSLAELMAEREHVRRLLDLARRVCEKGDESKFDKLLEFVRDPKYRDEKVLIFSEHRDTLDFLVRKLEGLGFAGQIAHIHGGMDYREREEQVEFFRRPVAEEGARYLVATDAAGEGINLQFCWLMVNYDIPWNPARLEQRMGRVHRYKQQHDPVVIANLVAGKTREGRVIRTLLDKLELIRKQLGSDKVFDVVGRLFEGVSLREYLENSLTDQAADESTRKLEGVLTKEQVTALGERDRSLFGDGGEVKARLAEEREKLEREELRRLLPGYVRRFVERAAPLLGLRVEGDLDTAFSLSPARPGALDPLWPILESYPPEARDRLTVHRPRGEQPAVFLRPGEALFERLRSLVFSRFAAEALRGAVFIDAYAKRPYLFHLVAVGVRREADPNLSSLANPERLECRLIGLRQEAEDRIEECPMEHLVLLRGRAGVSADAMGLVSVSPQLRDLARAYALEHVARPRAEDHRGRLVQTLGERESFIVRGYGYEESELADMRSQLRERAEAGDAAVKAEIQRIRERQKAIATRRDEAIAVLRREPELIVPEDPVFVAHALVVPSTDPEDRLRHDTEVEANAIRVAWAYETGEGANVQDVSTPDRARANGLTDHPGFDILSRRPSREELAIEVKGRAGVGDVELTENEWDKAYNLRERYWLYVVFDCATPRPRLVRIQDPFHKLFARAKGGVIIEHESILRAEDTR